MKPIPALLVSLLVFVVCAAGTTRLSINADTRVFFSQSNENRIALDLFEQRYTSGVNLLIALHAPQGDVFTDARLKAIERITEGGWRIPYAVRVESITNAAHIRSNGDDIFIEEAASLGVAGNAEDARDRVMDDGLLVGRLVALDGATAGINVTVQYPMHSSHATGEILAAAKRLVAESGVEASGLEAWYGGRVASSFAFSSASKSDLKTLIPLTFATFLIILVLLVRSPVLAGALFLTTVLAATSALGLGGWLGLKINAATAHVATVIISLGVASLLHLAISVRRFLGDGLKREEAITSAVKTDRWPIALTLCTTSVGFLTLLAADAPPFREVGALTAAGACFTLFYGLMFLPAFLRRVPLHVKSKPSLLSVFVQFAARVAIDQRAVLRIGIPVIGAIVLFGLSHIKINDTFSEYFDERYEFRRHAELIEAHLTGLEVVEFDIGEPDEGAIFERAYVEKLTAFEDWLATQPKVVYVSSILEVYRRLNQHLTDGRPESRQVPNDQSLLAQYMLLYEMSLPAGQELTNSVTIDKSRSRVTAILNDASTSEVRAFRESAERWLARTGSKEISGTGTGLAVMFAYLSSLNVESMLGGTAVALVIISFVLIFAFRSLKYGVVSLLPNLFPGLLAFGVWGYFVGEIGVAVSVVGAMTLGIIVDDTIHIIFRYREARAQGAGPVAAARKMFAKVGEPMLISTTALVAGFSLLATSGFHITSSSGYLVAGAIAFALILDWLFLVPVLIGIDRVRVRRRVLAGRIRRSLSIASA